MLYRPAPLHTGLIAQKIIFGAVPTGDHLSLRSGGRRRAARASCYDVLVRFLCFLCLLPAVAIAIAACRAEPKPVPISVSEQQERIQVSRTWSIVVPRSFQKVDHSTDWQAFDGHRTVFVKSYFVTAPEGGPSAVANLGTMSSEWLGGEGAGEKIEHRTHEFQGEAVIRATPAGFELKGYMAKPGSVAVCVIDFDNERFTTWATGAWRSLGMEEAPR